MRRTMSEETYDLLSDDERYALLHRVFDRALELAQDEWLPTPGQIAHCSFAAIGTAYQQAVREYQI